MMRLLPWLILIALVIWALRTNAGKSRGSGSSGKAGNTGDRSSGFKNHVADPVDAETMISCERCQVYFPASEVVHRDGHNFCSVAHAEAH